MTKKNKMVKCPRCQKEIFGLDNYQSGENRYFLDLDGEYDLKEFKGDGKSNEFECPSCGKVLFDDEEKAKKFLGVKEVEE